MGRALRLYHPGSAFHIVSRTQGQDPWFTDDVKDTIADTLLSGVTSGGARPVAFAVMDNHFHLILFQGRMPLGELMQAPLRRIALLIQKRQGRVGHVFERRFRAKLCHDTEHLPNAILYVHRNPVEAGMCETPTDYRWSSANAFEARCPPGLLCVDDGLRAFDPTGTASLEALRASYGDRLNRRDDATFSEYWSWFMRSNRKNHRLAQPFVPSSPHLHRAPLRDIRDVALGILRSIDDTVPPDLIRSRYGGQRIVHVRTQLIAALTQRGYAGVSIARFLRISEATVSRVRSAIRWGSIQGISKSDSIEDGKQVR